MAVLRLPDLDGRVLAIEPSPSAGVLGPVPIAATFPIEQIRAAVELQRAGHVHGKVVIALA